MITKWIQDTDELWHKLYTFGRFPANGFKAYIAYCYKHIEASVSGLPIMTIPKDAKSCDLCEANKSPNPLLPPELSYNNDVVVTTNTSIVTKLQGNTIKYATYTSTQDGYVVTWKKEWL